MLNKTLTQQRSLLAIALGHTGLCLVVLAFASVHHPDYRFFFRPERFWPAFAIVSGFAITAKAFATAEFSFGYVVSYYFYLTIIGFLWINEFTALEYDHLLAAVSAALSAAAFAAPALTITRGFHYSPKLSAEMAQSFVYVLMALCLVIIIVGVSYSFQLFTLTSYSAFRDELLKTAAIRNSIGLPTLLGYGVGIMSNAIMPFAFAFFLERKKYWFGALALLLLAGFFPITLTKSSLISPVWLLFVAVLATIFEARIAAMLTMFIPMAAGLFVIQLWPAIGGDLFDLLDFRLFVIPSAAMSFYSDFFSHHPTTLFCQIGPIGKIFGCPYEELGLVMAKAYGLGHYNASLFATEGTASVGPFLSPVSTLLCGIAVAAANRVSAGLPARFVLVSSGVIVPMLLNVPFSIVLLTHGAAVLFLLWYLVPRRLTANT